MSSELEHLRKCVACLHKHNERLRAQDARMRSALCAIVNYFELSLGFREGDKEYQVVILAREALK